MAFLLHNIHFSYNLRTLVYYFFVAFQTKLTIKRRIFETKIQIDFKTLYKIRVNNWKALIFQTINTLFLHNILFMNFENDL